MIHTLHNSTYQVGYTWYVFEFISFFRVNNFKTWTNVRRSKIIVTKLNSPTNVFTRTLTFRCRQKLFVCLKTANIFKFHKQSCRKIVDGVKMVKWRITTVITSERDWLGTRMSLHYCTVMLSRGSDILQFGANSPPVIHKLSSYQHCPTFIHKLLYWYITDILLSSRYPNII